MSLQEDWEKWQDAQQYVDYEPGPPPIIKYKMILQSGDFQSGKDGWRILPRGDFEVASLKARGEIDTLSFRANNMNAINGSLLITQSAVLKAEVGENDTQIMVSDKSFDVGDVLYLRMGRRSPEMGKGRRTLDNYEYMYVTAGPSYFKDKETGEECWVYTVSRSYGEPDEKAKRWRRGTAVVCWIDKSYGAILMAADRDNSPYIDILQRDSTQINSFLTRVRLGRLDGIVDTVLNPQGYGLYTDNIFLRGKLAIGGGYENTGIELYDSVGTQRGNITPNGTGWFGSSENFWWDAGGNVYIKTLTTESVNADIRDSLICRDDCTVKDFLYVEGSIITTGINWDVQNLYVAKSLVVQNDATIKDYLYVQDRIIVGDAEVTGTMDVGSIDCQDAIIRKDALIKDDATVKDVLRVESFSYSKGLILNNSGGPIEIRFEEGGTRRARINYAPTSNELRIIANETGSRIHICSHSETKITKDLLIYNDATVKDNIKVGGIARLTDLYVSEDVVVQNDATIRGDIYVEDERGSVGHSGRGVTCDFTACGMIYHVVDGLITEIKQKQWA